MPGRATPGYKLALQAGYVMKKTTKGSKTTTAPWIVTGISFSILIKLSNNLF